MRIRPVLAALLLSVASTAALLLPSSPALAKPVDYWGFAYFDNPTAVGWVTLDPSRQWGSWKTAYPADVVTGTRVAAGRYYVRFPHLASVGLGIVHVTAVDRAGHYCAPTSWKDSGADLLVGVACFKPGGAWDDSMFSVLFTVGSTYGYSAAPGAYAFVRYGTTGIVTQDNSASFANTVTPFGTGMYEVKLPGVASTVTRGLSGNLQATAIVPNAQPRRCKIAKWGISGADVVAYVFCHDNLGALVNSEFSVSYHRERSVVATYPPKYFGYVWTPDMAGPTNYNNLYGYGANSSLPVIGLPGYYGIKFPGIGEKETHAQVTAYGDNANYCNITPVWYGSPDLTLPGICFANSGASAPTQFFATATSRL